MKKFLKIVQIYPREMNIYGDDGNVLALKKRAELYGFSPEISAYEVGDSAEILRNADILVGGGGQDSGQEKVAADLQKNAAVFREIAADGKPMLAICGTFQLFGNFFRTAGGNEIAGAEIFDLKTVAGEKRLVGNIVIKTDFGEIVGYENHSGLTFLAQNQASFGEVLAGAGNNNSDKTEGARSFNAFGSYLHGPILPKNPSFSDEILRIAVERKFGEKKLIPRDEFSRDEISRLNFLAKRAREIAKTRGR